MDTITAPRVYVFPSRSQIPACEASELQKVILAQVAESGRGLDLYITNGAGFILNT